jgi:hypothetical protein
MATGFQKWPTALVVIQDVCGQLGLPVPKAGVTAPDDETAQQMVSLLTWCGRRLTKPTGTMRWSSLKRTWTLATIPNQTLYDLPADWDSFIDSTAWNTTSRLPMLGPATDPQWSTLRARNLGASTISVIYRTRNNKFEIYNAYSTPQNLIIDYSSRAWVYHASGTPPSYTDAVSADDDQILYDNELITAKLKLAFLQAKGFDTTVATSDYNEIEEQALNADTDAPVLSASSSSRGYPLISNLNVPDSGYGL